MLYCDRNFKTKKQLKEAVAAGHRVTAFAPEPQESVPENGRGCVGGPHFPEPHKWYATVTFKDGAIVKVS